MLSGASFLTPMNSFEATLSIAHIAYGLFFGSAHIAKLSGIVVQLQDVSRETCARKCQLHIYFQQRGIDYHRRYLVESQYAFRIAEQENLVTEHDIAPMLACLSARLRDNLLHTFTTAAAESRHTRLVRMVTTSSTWNCVS